MAIKTKYKKTNNDLHHTETEDWATQTTLKARGKLIHSSSVNSGFYNESVYQYIIQLYIIFL